VSWFDELAELVRDYVMEETRAGFYIATVTNAHKSYRRQDAEPEWVDDGESLEDLLRISSPIIDVIPATGTRVAVISQDGLPEAGAVLGAVTDDKQPNNLRTVWIRADLEDHEGFVELGATKGVRISVGPNPDDLTPVSTNDIEVDCPGEIRLGAAAVEYVALASLVKTQLDAMRLVLNGHLHSGVTTGPGTSGPLVTPLPALGGVASTKTKSE